MHKEHISKNPYEPLKTPAIPSLTIAIVPHPKLSGPPSKRQTSLSIPKQILSHLPQNRS
jgi:hypothetical protein